jgi:hypothetical protein
VKVTQNFGFFPAQTHCLPYRRVKFTVEIVWSAGFLRPLESCVQSGMLERGVELAMPGERKKGRNMEESLRKSRILGRFSTCVCKAPGFEVWI